MNRQVVDRFVRFRVNCRAVIRSFGEHCKDIARVDGGWCFVLDRVSAGNDINCAEIDRLNQIRQKSQCSFITMLVSSRLIEFGIEIIMQCVVVENK